ncbi:anchored repeat-type ABC transporter ATP-binding subunit [Rothia uropygioeca]|uniref:anchored repeat-type ABC transporter ATP-binding subunit n=1 Tax=Kocuria sp. 257 TaxID=2021970 RepID=UPI0010107482|nr:anchored repeat-type ABC transporter ATP-binding subunit [Kocuria sp. 257]
MTVNRLEISGLTVSLGGRVVIDSLDWEVGAGEFVALIGPNGTGKTTLLRTILGLVSPVAGKITVAGHAPARARAALGYVPQKHHFAWDYPLTVEDAVMIGRTRRIGWFRRPKIADWAAVHEALDRTGLVDLRRRSIGELSGGQRQRVLLARTLATDPRFLLLDEPFTGVDAPTQDKLSQLYTALARDGLGIVMSTHDVLGALTDCSRICGLRGHIDVDAPASELDAASLNTWLRGRPLASCGITRSDVQEEHS